MKYLLAAFVLSFLIMVHELGHFIAGRLAGIPVDRFSVGFGPRLWGFVWRGTEIRLSAIPLGGYVLPRLQDEMEYFRLGLGKRLFFAMGGPAANILIAGMLFAAMNAAKGDITVYSVTVAPLLQLFDMTGQILASLLSVFSGDGRISSVLGIVATGGRFIENGFIQACTFTALMSLNLAVFNLLPCHPSTARRWSWTSSPVSSRDWPEPISPPACAAGSCSLESFSTRPSSTCSDLDPAWHDTCRLLLKNRILLVVHGASDCRCRLAKLQP